MDLDCGLDSSYSGGAFTVESFSCDTVFAKIEYDAVMIRDYRLCGGSGGGAFTRTPFYGENSMLDLEMMQVSPEADGWNAACAVAWSMPPNFRN